jgi:hypothetical protein
MLSDDRRGRGRRAPDQRDRAGQRLFRPDSEDDGHGKAVARVERAHGLRPQHPRNRTHAAAPQRTHPLCQKGYPSYAISICYRRRRRFTCRVINSKGPFRHGAEPKRSVRKSSKTLTLGSRCRPGGNRAHNGKSPGSCASCNTGSRSPFCIAGATTGSPWRMIPTPAMASFNNMSALSALTGPFTLTGTNSPSIRNCQIDAPGMWLIVRHECRSRSEGRIGRPWEER